MKRRSFLKSVAGVLAIGSFSRGGSDPRTESHGLTSTRGVHYSDICFGHHTHDVSDTSTTALGTNEISMPPHSHDPRGPSTKSMLGAPCDRCGKPQIVRVPR